MIKVDKRPTEGQFIAVWEHEGEIWSSTFDYDNENCLLHYVASIPDKWVHVGDGYNEVFSNGAEFYILK